MVFTPKEGAALVRCLMLTAGPSASTQLVPGGPELSQRGAEPQASQTEGAEPRASQREGAEPRTSQTEGAEPWAFQRRGRSHGHPRQRGQSYRHPRERGWSYKLLGRVSRGFVIERKRMCYL